MDLLHPVAQRVHHHLQDARVLQIERVAAAGDVEVVARVAVENVVAGVVGAAEREGGAQVAALGGVVVDDVEDDLDAGLVEAAHHQLELVQVAFRRDVARRRRKEADGVRSEEHTSELQSLMRISYAVFCLKKKKKSQKINNH